MYMHTFTFLVSLTTMRSGRNVGIHNDEASTLRGVAGSQGSSEDEKEVAYRFAELPSEPMITRQASGRGRIRSGATSFFAIFPMCKWRLGFL